MKDEYGRVCMWVTRWFLSYFLLGPWGLFQSLSEALRGSLDGIMSHIIQMGAGRGKDIPFQVNFIFP